MYQISKELISPILDEMVWSYSRVNAYCTCPRMFYYTYILKAPKRDNFFSQYGQFIHSIMEKYGKNELELFELIPYYEQNYQDNIVESAPPNKYKDLNDDYYQKGYNYLCNFEGFSDETLDIEKNVDFNLKLQNRTIRFTGYIDRVSRIDDKYIKIVDYKSKQDFKTDTELEHYLYQLYLYSIPAKEIYGKEIKSLEFEMFRIGKTITCQYKKEMLDKALSWVDKTIENIYNDTEYKMQKKIDTDFFCQQLCSCYSQCVDDLVNI